MEEQYEQYGYCKDERYSRNRGDLVIAYQLIVSDLNRIFEFIEPSDINLKCYSHRIYELFLRACTEVDSNFKGIMCDNGYAKPSNMDHYKKTNAALKLNEYQLKLERNNNGAVLTPFDGFGKSAPDSHSPEWYKAYNSVKHNRLEKFNEANLGNLINAVAGLYVLLFSQFGICANYSSEPHFLVGSKGLSDANEYAVIFTITGKPIFSDSERYDFQWDQLKDTQEPYNKYDF